MGKKKLKDYLEGLDEPILIGQKKGAISRILGGKPELKVIIHNEDGSASEHLVKWPSSYVIEIGSKSYILVAKCVLRMSIPTIHYFFNNPFPIFFEYTLAGVKASDLYSDDMKKYQDTEVMTYLQEVEFDAETLSLAFNTRFLRGLYGNQGLTLMNWLLIGGGILIFILVLLQASGRVDIIGNLFGTLKAVGGVAQ